MTKATIPVKSDPPVPSMNDVVVKLKAELQTLTGFKPESVIAIKKLENEWKLVIEMLEKTGIPDKMDILGSYEVTADIEGSIASYERKSLRKRGDTGMEEASEESQ
jgi:hypothetical protein